jgi:hypothetical protein
MIMDQLAKLVPLSHITDYSSNLKLKYNKMLTAALCCIALNLAALLIVMETPFPICW